MKVQPFQKTEKFLFGFLLFTLFWLPLALGTNRPWAWSLMQVSLFMQGALLVLIHHGSYANWYTTYKKYIWVWAAFLIWQLINITPLPFFIIELVRPERLHGFITQHSLFAPSHEKPWLSLSFDIGQSHITFMKSLAYCFLFFISLSLINTSKRLKATLITLSAAGIFQAIYGSVEVLSGMQQSMLFDLPVTHIATGSFVYKNHYANYLLLSLSAAIGYLIASLHLTHNSTKRERLRRMIKFWLSNKVLFRIGIIIMVIALVMSRSRMGNSAFFISMTLTATLGLIYFKPRQKSYVTLFVSMLIIDILIVSSLFGLKQVQERLEQTSFAQESRDEVIADSVPLLADYPLLGSGGGTFYTLYPRVQNEKIQHFYDHAHNEYLQFALEFGFVGVALLGLLVVLCTVCSFRAIRKRRHPLPRGAAFASFMAVIGMALHATVDFPLQATANAAYFVVLLSLGIISSEISMRTKVKNVEQH
ncbi:O-antigen ligase family protein [Alteromonas sp. BMJM2]|uniref:O-antigen ligase family protein n=1 Tax=Alteromonas sp. BMJM2 TaxID=2954241 RepID=UPI0022B46054|nr:O-antigen ligase family protein [Alteromonas sp. BMJM2]